MNYNHTCDFQTPSRNKISHKLLQDAPFELFLCRLKYLKINKEVVSRKKIKATEKRVTQSKISDTLISVIPAVQSSETVSKQVKF